MTFPTPEEINTAFRIKAKKEQELNDKARDVANRVKARCRVRHANEVVEKLGPAIAKHVEKGNMTFQRGSHGEPNTISLGRTLVHVILGDSKKGPVYYTEADLGLETMELGEEERKQIYAHDHVRKNLATALRDFDYWKDEVFPLVIDLLSQRQYFASASYTRKYDSAEAVVPSDAEAVYINDVIDDAYLMVTMHIRVKATK